MQQERPGTAAISRQQLQRRSVETSPPFHLLHPDVPQRIQQLLHDARMIVLLRHQVDRAISQLFHAKKRGFEPLEPADALQAEASRLANGDPVSLQKHSHVSRSRYLEQLERYGARFASDQMLIMHSEDCFEQPVKIWQLLQQFLVLQSVELPMALPRTHPAQAKPQN